MQLRVFCFFDSKVGVFSTPFFCRHVGEALRIAQQLGEDPQTQIGRYPADFSLVEVGSFDDQTGVMTALPHHSHGVVAGFLAAKRSLQSQLAFDEPAKLGEVM